MVSIPAHSNLHQKERSINARVMGGASRGMPKKDKARGGPGEVVHVTLLFYLLFSLASGLTSDFSLPEGIWVQLLLGSALLAEQTLFLFVFLSEML